MAIKKIWRKTTRLERILETLEKDWKYSREDFWIDVVDFLNDENNVKFGKHGIVIKWGKVRSIILWYDFRTLYFLEEQKGEWVKEYVFFDIWDHDHVYTKKISKKFRINRE